MRLVLLKTFVNYIEANIVMSMLEEEGIVCHLEGENAVTLTGMASGMKLMVHEGQAERAAEVLIAAEGVFVNSIPCPRCNNTGLTLKIIKEDHSAALKRLPLGRLMVFLQKNFSKEGTHTIIKHYVCNHCGKEFDDIPS